MGVPIQVIATSIMESKIQDTIWIKDSVIATEINEITICSHKIARVLLRAEEGINHELALQLGFECHCLSGDGAAISL